MTQPTPQAYRAQAKRRHPDVNGGSSAMFQELTQAMAEYKQERATL